MGTGPQDHRWLASDGGRGSTAVRDQQGPRISGAARLHNPQQGALGHSGLVRRFRQLLSLGSQPLWVSVSSTSPATLAMDQPAGLQVDYVFRGVEHAVRVMVSGQVLELEVEDRMTADQWRGEFDANCECACLGGLACPSPESVSPRR